MTIVQIFLTSLIGSATGLFLDRQFQKSKEAKVVKPKPKKGKTASPKGGGAIPRPSGAQKSKPIKKEETKKRAPSNEIPAQKVIVSNDIKEKISLSDGNKEKELESPIGNLKNPRGLDPAPRESVQTLDLDSLNQNANETDVKLESVEKQKPNVVQDVVQDDVQDEVQDEVQNNLGNKLRDKKVISFGDPRGRLGNMDERRTGDIPPKETLKAKKLRDKKVISFGDRIGRLGNKNDITSSNQINTNKKLQTLNAKRNTKGGLVNELEQKDEIKTTSKKPITKDNLICQRLKNKFGQDAQVLKTGQVVDSNREFILQNGRRVSVGVNSRTRKVDPQYIEGGCYAG